MTTKPLVNDLESWIRINPGYALTLKGSFLYTKKSPEILLKGVFAFTFYIQKSMTRDSLIQNLYIQGIDFYKYFLQRHDSIFQGWRCLVYTDRFTYEEIQRKLPEFLASEVLDVVIVDWPYYDPERNLNTLNQKTNGHINGDVLRVMRFRAFFDFPTIPVFIRDADTLWSGEPNMRGIRTIQIHYEAAYKWEANFYKEATQYPNTFIFGTSLYYLRSWHTHKNTKKMAPLGALAGFQNSMPTLHTFENDYLWGLSLTYILDSSYRTKNGFSNKNEKLRVGKDEQILLFYFLPALKYNKDKIFYFEIDLDKRRPLKRRGRNLSNPQYPLILFEQGSNEKLQKILDSQNNKLRQGYITQELVEQNLAEMPLQSYNLKMELRRELKQKGINNVSQNQLQEYVYNLYANKTRKNKKGAKVDV